MLDNYSGNDIRMYFTGCIVEYNDGLYIIDEVVEEDDDITITLLSGEGMLEDVYSASVLSLYVFKAGLYMIDGEPIFLSRKPKTTYIKGVGPYTVIGRFLNHDADNVLVQSDLLKALGNPIEGDYKTVFEHEGKKYFRGKEL